MHDLFKTFGFDITPGRPTPPPTGPHADAQAFQSLALQWAAIVAKCDRILATRTKP